MGLRQIDLASKAEVNIVEVTALEKGRCVRLKRANKIFIILGLPILTEDSKGVFIRG
jgi:hypothetical protein